MNDKRTADEVWDDAIASKFTYDPNMEMPPTEIIQAAILIENWMKMRGHKHWKLMGVQSREI